MTDFTLRTSKPASTISRETLRTELNNYLIDQELQQRRLDINDARLTDEFCQALATKLGQAYEQDEVDENFDASDEVLRLALIELGIDPRSEEQVAFEIKNDFTKWVGHEDGPESDEQIEQYIRFAAPSDMADAQVRQVLTAWMKEEAPRIEARDALSKAIGLLLEGQAWLEAVDINQFNLQAEINRLNQVIRDLQTKKGA